MNETANVKTSHDSVAETETRDFFSSPAYARAKRGSANILDDEATTKKRKVRESDTESDYIAGLARPRINRQDASKIREIIVEDDEIADLRKESGFRSDSNHSEEMQNMMTILTKDVMKLSSVQTARDIRNATSTERTDELTLHIACLPKILAEYESKKTDRTKSGNILRIIPQERYVSTHKVDSFRKTSLYLNVMTEFKRLFFAKKIGRKSPPNSNERFQDIMQLVHPVNEIVSMHDFLESVHGAVGLYFTQMYITDKQLGSIATADIYLDNKWYALSKCVMIFMGASDHTFGLYILGQMYYEPKYRYSEIAGASSTYANSTRDMILEDSRESSSHKAKNENRTYEHMMRYFNKNSKVRDHHVMYTDIYGDSSDDRSPLGELLDSFCFRVEFLDAGFIPTID